MTPFGLYNDELLQQDWTSSLHLIRVAVDQLCGCVNSLAKNLVAGSHSANSRSQIVQPRKKGRCAARSRNNLLIELSLSKSCRLGSKEGPQETPRCDERLCSCSGIWSIGQWSKGGREGTQAALSKESGDDVPAVDEVVDSDVVAPVQHNICIRRIGTETFQSTWKQRKRKQPVLRRRFCTYRSYLRYLSKPAEML